MLQKAMNTPGVSAIELNLACPNIPGKPMVAYDYDQLDIALGRVCKLPGYGKIPIGVKLAPYFDIPHFQRVADILAKYPIHYIVSVNTIPNGLVIDFDNECEGIVPKQGLGGLAGGFIKHTALANVRTLYNMLQERGRSDIDIVGVGGVRSGKDAFELILCGAKAVQVGTCHWTEGAGCFDRIAKELQEIMVKRGYKRIEDFRGKLKPYRRPARKAANEGVEKSAATTASKSGNQFDLLHIVLVAAVALLSILLAFGKSLFGL